MNAACRQLVDDIEALEREAKVVYHRLVLPHWEEKLLHGFPKTLYGYMMVCFSYVDLVSAYWKGSSSQNGQSKRMVDFMEAYMLLNRETCSVAVQMWRHKLMHTARPRPLVNEGTGKVHRWLLHWEEHLPAEQHFTLTETGDSKTLKIGLIYLVRDLKDAVKDYLAELPGDIKLQSNFERVESEIQIGKFKPFAASEKIGAVAANTEIVVEDPAPWLTAADLMWRPLVPDEHDRVYSLGELKEIFRRVRDVRRNPGTASDSEYHRLHDHLRFACYSTFRFSSKPSGIGWSREMDDLWYETLVWEYRQWMQRIVERSRPALGRHSSDITAERATIGALLLLLPGFRLGQSERPDWSEFSIELELLWRWTLLRGRALSDKEFEALAWYAFPGEYRTPIAVVFDPLRERR